jgi:hypothetical protein
MKLETDDSKYWRLKRRITKASGKRAIELNFTVPEDIFTPPN